MGSGNFHVVYSGTKYPDEAKGLLKYFGAKDWYPAFVTKVSPVSGPVFDSLASDEVWNTYPGKIVFDGLANCHFPGYPGPASGIGGKTINIKGAATCMQNVLVNGMSVDEAIAVWEKDIQKVLDEN